MPPVITITISEDLAGGWSVTSVLRTATVGDPWTEPMSFARPETAAACANDIARQAARFWPSAIIAINTPQPAFRPRTTTGDAE